MCLILGGRCLSSTVMLRESQHSSGVWLDCVSFGF
uniref:Uncharacterized protein n=1 Tax=Anguilla anguilla TaxID=7936 RepID=A0A0E9UHK5_ANGAN